MKSFLFLANLISSGIGPLTTGFSLFVWNLTAGYAL